MPNTCIVVLGMHRSGTSLVAGILYRLGVNMGSAFRAPDRHNTGGYYEDLDFRDINKVIINRAGGRWFNPPNVEDVSEVTTHYASRIEKLVSSRSGTWGFKDPRTAFTIHALEKHLPDDLRFIRVSRNSLDITSSLANRATIMGYTRSGSHWFSIMKRYEDRIQDYLRGSIRPVFTIDYGDLVCASRTLDTVQRLAHFCDVDWQDEDLIGHAVKLVLVKYK